MSKQRQSIVLILGSAIGLCACATSTQLPEPMAPVTEAAPAEVEETDQWVQMTGTRIRYRADQPVMNSFPLVSHDRDELLGTGLARRNLADALMLINPTIR